MNTARDMAKDYQLGHSYMGAAMCNAKWIDNQWSSIPTETYTQIAEALADENTKRAGDLLHNVLNQIARREAEARFGVKL